MPTGNKQEEYYNPIFYVRMNVTLNKNQSNVNALWRNSIVKQFINAFSQYVHLFKFLCDTFRTYRCTYSGNCSKLRISDVSNSYSLKKSATQ